MQTHRHRAGALVLAMALLLVSALPVLAADGRDPRCAEWERSGPPTGTDMRAACPPAGPTTAAVELDSQPLVPWVVALLVVGGVLTLFGFVAMRFTAPGVRTGAHRPGDWWRCPACRSPNAPDRRACFACQASRAEPGPPHPA